MGLRCKHCRALFARVCRAATARGAVLLLPPVAAVVSPARRRRSMRRPEMIQSQSRVAEEVVAAAAHSGGESARFVSLARGSDAAAAAHGGGEQSDTMHFNRMAFDHLSAGEGEGGAASIDIREEGDDAARPRDGLPDDDGAAARSGRRKRKRKRKRTIHGFDYTTCYGEVYMNYEKNYFIINRASSKALLVGVASTLKGRRQCAQYCRQS